MLTTTITILDLELDMDADLTFDMRVVGAERSMFPKFIVQCV